MDPRHKSRIILEGPDRAPARSYLKAVGFTDQDLARPIVGVAHCWIEVTPCNWNHQKLAEKVKEGIRAAGGTPIEYNTVSVTDGIAMGTGG
jgi:dihydroxy-acid dehydratase